MNRNLSELKRIARGNLMFRYKIPVWAVLFSYFLVLLVTAPFESVYTNNPSNLTAVIYIVASILCALLISLLLYGQVYVALKLARLKEPANRDLFVFFKNQPDRYIIGSLILIGLSILFMIPFVIFEIALGRIIVASDMTLYILSVVLEFLSGICCVIGMTKFLLFPFLLIDRQDLSVKECFKLSLEKSKGQMKRIIKAVFSFIGWGLLGLCSCFIGFLWVIPYFTETMTVLYLDITGELSSLEYQKMKPVENPNDPVGQNVDSRV